MYDTEPEAQTGPPVECQLHEAYYRSLVRLAALLTGDQDAAEDVASAAIAALPSCLAPDTAASTDDVARFLQRQVLLRYRHARPRRRGTPGFAGLPVVQALQELPPHGREAV